MYQYSEVVQMELQRKTSISCSVIVYNVYIPSILVWMITGSVCGPGDMVTAETEQL